MKKTLSVIFTLFILASCTKDEITIDKDNLLIGTWNLVRYDNNTRVYSRAPQFSDTYCYQFNSDGTLSERGLSGFCGTPPVSYSDYRGTWTETSNSDISVNVDYWGGSRSYILHIVSLDTDTLRVDIR